MALPGNVLAVRHPPVASGASGPDQLAVLLPGVPTSHSDARGGRASPRHHPQGGGGRGGRLAISTTLGGGSAVTTTLKHDDASSHPPRLHGLRHTARPARHSSSSMPQRTTGA